MSFETTLLPTQNDALESNTALTTLSCCRGFVACPKHTALDCLSQCLTLIGADMAASPLAVPVTRCDACSRWRWLLPSRRAAPRTAAACCHANRLTDANDATVVIGLFFSIFFCFFNSWPNWINYTQLDCRPWLQLFQHFAFFSLKLPVSKRLIVQV